ncbi:hypothetical protein [Chryseobacterium terrae]|uniref:Uncharacterized protein n=1 Tax=Chryseobacterium terrae TaxID=3163299 RepID=A0ABW8XXQ5_9FLAO
MKKSFLLIIFPILSYGQLSTRISELYKELSKSERYEGSHIGYEGKESKVYNTYKEINKLASDKEIEYIAFNGNAVPKMYATKTLFEKKSKQFLKAFNYARQNNQQLKGISGCVGYSTFLADKIYQIVFQEKEIIRKAKEFKIFSDSILNAKNLPDGYDKSIIEEFKVETKWTNPEIDSLLLKMEELVLNDKNSSQSLVELVCEYNFYTNQKKPYYDKLLYFDKKYNSELIKQYLGLL